jgi:hypothetical protein
MKINSVRKNNQGKHGQHNNGQSTEAGKDLTCGFIFFLDCFHANLLPPVYDVYPDNV